MDERTLTIPGRFENLARISDFITQAARDAGFGADDVFHIQMAVDEACSNVIEHAYGQQLRGDITIACRVEGSRFQVDVHDHGQPFDPGEVPVPRFDPQAVDLDEIKVGGLGIFFMRKLMDEVTFRFDEATGNHLTMIKWRPS